MPLPKKKLKMLPDAAAVAAAVGAAEPPTRPVVVVAAAALADFDAPSSRREAAKAVQANGANAGASPLPPVANHDSRLEPTPATEVDAAARGVATAAAGAADETDSTTATGAAAAGASLLVTTTASEGVEATVREAGTSAVDESTAVPLLPAEGVTTGELLWPRRWVAAADDDAPLRGAVELSDEVEPDEAPLPPRRAGEALVDDVDAPLDA